jgi:GNAT superfamily N-acetyltransferase
MVDVRPVEVTDADELGVVHVRAWQAAYPGMLAQDYLDGLDVAQRAASWRERLGERRPGSAVLVATVGGRVVGFVAFGAAREAEPGADGEVYAINVDPAHWRDGVGSALLAAGEAGLADLGHRHAELWVVTRNVRARRFYESRGWVCDDVERTRAVDGVSLPEIRYARDLP